MCANLCFTLASNCVDVAACRSSCAHEALLKCLHRALVAKLMGAELVASEPVVPHILAVSCARCGICLLLALKWVCCILAFVSLLTLDALVPLLALGTCSALSALDALVALLAL